MQQVFDDAPGDRRDSEQRSVVPFDTLMSRARPCACGTGWQCAPECVLRSVHGVYALGVSDTSPDPEFDVAVAAIIPKAEVAPTSEHDLESPGPFRSFSVSNSDHKKCSGSFNDATSILC